MNDEPKKNLSCVLIQAQTIECRDMPIPAIGDKDVLVEIMSTGLCGSDLHIWTHGAAGPLKVIEPLTLGHESAGRIAKIGSKATLVQVGDHVAIEPNQPCRTCRACTAGTPELCNQGLNCGLPPVHGSICQWFALPQEFVVKVPLHINWKIAGCIQPLAVAVHIADRAGLRASQTVAVFGSGPLGLMTMAVAKAYGCSKIIAFDISTSRVDFAKEHYATHGFASEKKPDEMDSMVFARQAAQKVISKVGLDGGVDVVIEASGAESCMQAGVALVRPGGVYIQAGIGKETANFPILHVMAKQLDVRGIVRYGPRSFHHAIDLLARGLVDLSPLVTSTYPIGKSAEAFQALKAQSDIKIVILSKVV